MPDGCRPTALLQQIANGDYKPADLIAARAAAIEKGDLLTCVQFRTSPESGTGTHFLDVVHNYTATATGTAAIYTLTVHQGLLPGFPESIGGGYDAQHL